MNVEEASATGSSSSSRSSSCGEKDQSSIKRNDRKRRRPSGGITTSSSSSSANATGIQRQDQEHQKVLSDAASTSIESALRFRTQHHSLRLSASRIAALAGFNPYADLPSLVLDLVYQGSTGQLLLRHDTSLLGMQLVSKDSQLQDLATKAGPQVNAALREISDIRDGIKAPPATVSVADTIKSRTVTLARQSKNLTSQELGTLVEGVRSAVDTSFGTHYEDEALDMYERRYGCEVRERNSQIWTWEYGRADDVVNVDLFGHDDAVRTVVPLGDARPLQLQLQLKSQLQASDALLDGDSTRESNSNSEDKTSAVVEESGSIEGGEASSTAEQSSDGEDKSNNTAAAALSVPVVDLTDDARTPVSSSSSACSAERPFFCILGSIDGIRDELYCIPKASDGSSTRVQSSSSSPTASSSTDETSSDDTTWELRPIIVECKHRMKRVSHPPPLYDQIQSSVYCLMRGTAGADLVQVLRTEKKRRRKVVVEEEEDDKVVKETVQESEEIYAEKNEAVPCEEATDEKAETLLMKNVVEELDPEADCPNGTTSGTSSTVECDEKENGARLAIKELKQSSTDGGAEGTRKSTTKAENCLEINITVSRISLEDPATQHGRNFHRIILPRLRSVVDAVYSLRADDDKRYRFLLAASIDDKDKQKVAWQMLFDECEWLRSCDTAYSRL